MCLFPSTYGVLFFMCSMLLLFLNSFIPFQPMRLFLIHLQVVSHYKCVCPPQHSVLFLICLMLFLVTNAFVSLNICFIPYMAPSSSSLYFDPLNLLTCYAYISKLFLWLIDDNCSFDATFLFLVHEICSSDVKFLFTTWTALFLGHKMLLPF
jgi:hypothetical protein